MHQQIIYYIENYDEELDDDRNAKKIEKLNNFIKGQDIEKIFLSGQSQRIKSELYKVIDSSDVLLQVIDARDPMGTRSPHIEKYIKTNCSHKHIVIVLNKIDLIPIWATKRWIKLLSKEYPTIAFKSSSFGNNKRSNSSFGRGALISLLRQFRLLYKSSKRTISIGLFGYPNVGKSSIINCLKNKKVCSVAPIPGQTKVWQYVSLFDKFYLIDCPGCVYPRLGDNFVTFLLRSVVRVQLIQHPEQYIDEILKRIRKEYIQKLYEIDDWEDADDFMTQIAKKTGKLLKGGEPDYHNIAVNILYDWQRGKLPWFISPPFEDDLELQYKLNKEQLKIEQELKAFTEDDEIDYKPIEIKPMDEDEKDNNLNELDKSKKFSLSHDFQIDDTNEDKFRMRNNRNHNNDDDDDDNNHNEILNRMTNKQREKFDSIQISNPLNLPNDDPLIIAAKMRKWKAKRMDQD